MFLLKKKKNFILTPLPKKIKGGASHIMPKMSKILRWHKFLAKKVAGGVQNSAGYTIRPHFISPFKDFKFGSKTKKLWSFKVSTFPKFQKHVCHPPPSPFGSKGPFSTGFSWDVERKYLKKKGKGRLLDFRSLCDVSFRSCFFLLKKTNSKMKVDNYFNLPKSKRVEFVLFSDHSFKSDVGDALLDKDLS